MKIIFEIVSWNVALDFTFSSSFSSTKSTYIEDLKKIEELVDFAFVLGIFIWHRSDSLHLFIGFNIKPWLNDKAMLIL